MVQIFMAAITFIRSRHLSVANRSHQVIASTGHFLWWVLALMVFKYLLMLVLPPILVTLLVPNSLEIVIILLLLFADLERKRALLPQSLVWIRAEIGFAMIVGQNWWQQYHQCCLQWHNLPTIQNYSCLRYSWRLYHQSCPSTDWLGWVEETKAHK